MTQQPILPSSELPETLDDSSQLSPVQLEQVARAKRCVKPIFGAVALATFNFWCFAISAALSLFAVFFYPSGLVVTACLTLAAYNEQRGRGLLREFEPKGGLLLSYNQLAFLLLVLLYCSWRIVDCYIRPAPFDEYAQYKSVISQLLSESSVSGTDLDLDGLTALYKTYVMLSYAAIMALSSVIQGLCAWIYFRRYRLLKEFLQSTPNWVIDVLKAAS